MSPSPTDPVFDYGPDKAAYRKVAGSGARRVVCGGRAYWSIPAGVLTRLAREAFEDLAFYLRPSFLEKLAAILKDPAASDNDRFVARALLRNAVIAAEGELPLCQDTGTINVFGRKGHRVLTDGQDEEALVRGAAGVYRERNLRYSIMAPATVLDETNTGSNLPAQVDLAAAEGVEYKFLFMAKGGGSSNKTLLFQETKALLNEKSLQAFLVEKIAALGVAACPPYRVAVVVGGLSPEMTLKTVKLATAGYLDGLPRRGSKRGGAFRDRAWEERMLAIARETGLGAQFGGRHLAHETRFIRLPRHAGSCPVAIGVGCNADRNLKAKITAEGVFLEAVERNPARFLTGAEAGAPAGTPVDLNRPMPEILKALAALPVGTLVRLSGPLVVARDIAHARLKEQLDKAGSVPDYLKKHPVYYAGPAKTPRGYASGSFGPTTAQRMDVYLADLMKAGGSLVTLAKGNRAAGVTEACKTFGGFYLGTIGGAAALMAKEFIVASEVIDYADLGMEAVRRIVVKDLPAFVVCDDKGGNLYARRA
ncbi:MAG: FumA C-terminus/TtdB family hydratase beta subunit [Candidatus Aminicenantes bacterium]|nr:FumA C-terminus/TtdB family hydratase beta subunit [Candidatus Aminicenantes bacterium]